MNQEVLANMAKRIRAARKTVGMTQAELAEKMGLDQPTIANYERGHRAINVTDLPRLAEILEVSILYFFEGEHSEGK